jgi:hypothetical protein
MEAKDRSERDSSKNSICRLEWIAWAMDAARRHKETEDLGIPQREDPVRSHEE